MAVFHTSNKNFLHLHVSPHQYTTAHEISSKRAKKLFYGKVSRLGRIQSELLGVSAEKASLKPQQLLAVLK